LASFRPKVDSVESFLGFMVLILYRWDSYIVLYVC
jgi:hypothetical protein